jgi:DNA replication and repair protein RecF
MRLEWLQVGQVRNLEQVRVEACPGLNVFAGRNAGGKTAFLESIYLLARARSFRTPRIQEVVRKGAPALQVTARAAYRGGTGPVVTGIEKGRGQVTIRFNGTPVRTVSEQARHLPLVVVTPDSHALVTGSPKQRRHWLDWAMFHVEPDYLEYWREYMKALRHRNHLLKEGEGDAGLYRGWEKAMARHGEAVTAARQAFLGELAASLAETAGECFGPGLSVAMAKGWPEEGSFQDCLARSRGGDRAAGFSRFGPHRADISFTWEGEALSARFSRGQIKLFVCLLIMAEAAVLEKLTGEAPLFLLDDYSAELDEEASAHLLDQVMARGWQSFITTTVFREHNHLADRIRVFHVEHGEIVKVVK